MTEKVPHIIRHLPRLDSKHLTGFRNLPKPIADGLGLGILGV